MWHAKEKGGMHTGLLWDVVEEANWRGSWNNTAMKAAWTEDIRLTRGINVTPVILRVSWIAAILEKPKNNIHINKESFPWITFVISSDFPSFSCHNYFSLSIAQILLNRLKFHVKYMNHSLKHSKARPLSLTKEGMCGFLSPLNKPEKMFLRSIN
jgi:hypothetical protein